MECLVLSAKQKIPCSLLVAAIDNLLQPGQDFDFKMELARQSVGCCLCIGGFSTTTTIEKQRNN